MRANIVLLSWSTQLSGRERNLLARSEIGNTVSFIRGEAMDRNDRGRAAVGGSSDPHDKKILCPARTLLLAKLDLACSGGKG